MWYKLKAVRLTFLNTLTFAKLVWTFLSSLAPESRSAWASAKIDFIVNNPDFIEPPDEPKPTV